MHGGIRDRSGLFSYIDLEKCIPVNYPPCRGSEHPLLQVLNGIRSEASADGADIDAITCCSVGSLGLSPDDQVWDATFTKNRERLQQGKVFDKFMAKLLEQPEVKPLLSDEHFSVDGTLIEAWASHKSFEAQGCRQGRRRLQLPWPEAQERQPRLDQRPRRQALSQGGRPRGQIELHGHTR